MPRPSRRAREAVVTALVAPLVLACLLPGPAESQILPTLYDEDRFFVTLVTEAGDTLVLFTDTGGGLFVFSDAVERLGLAVLGPGDLENRFGVEVPEQVMRETGGRLVELPAFRPDADIPPMQTPWGEMKLAPVRSRAEVGDTGIASLVRDGMLGQAWFAGRVWTFDYPSQRLLVHEDGGLAVPAGGVRMTLGFQTGADGSRLTNYPRMRIVVDGDTLDMLFDTGATTVLSEGALAEIGDGRAAARATSFITRSILERWRERHPDWRVLEDAETGSGRPMIEARDVVIAGHRIDRVWFTSRPDANFHEWMSQWMDRKIEGAVGGNALRHFRVTVDYPNAAAFFQPR